MRLASPFLIFVNCVLICNKISHNYENSFLIETLHEKDWSQPGKEVMHHVAKCGEDSQDWIVTWVVKNLLSEFVWKYPRSYMHLWRSFWIINENVSSPPAETKGITPSVAELQKVRFLLHGIPRRARRGSWARQPCRSGTPDNPSGGHTYLAPPFGINTSLRRDVILSSFWWPTTKLTSVYGHYKVSRLRWGIWEGPI